MVSLVEFLVEGFVVITDMESYEQSREHCILLLFCLQCTLM